jgi:hypothetical protein
MVVSLVIVATAVVAVVVVATDRDEDARTQAAN